MLNVKGALAGVGVVEPSLASSAERRARLSSCVVRKSWVAFVWTSIPGWWDKGLGGAEFLGEGMVDS